MKVLSLNDESGLTLAEIIVAIAILMVGLVAVMQAFPIGTGDMNAGRRQSTADFLAEQKIEEIRAWSLSTSAGKGFANIQICNPCTGAAPFNQEGFNSIPGYADYSRTVIVQNGPTANTRSVQVTLSYRRVVSAGVFTDGPQVSVSTLIAQR